MAIKDKKTVHHRDTESTEEKFSFAFSGDAEKAKKSHR